MLGFTKLSASTFTFVGDRVYLVGLKETCQHPFWRKLGVCDFVDGVCIGGIPSGTDGAIKV